MHTFRVGWPSLIGQLNSRLQYDSNHCKLPAMSKSITIRDVPEHTCRELAARAALSGRSMQGYLREKLIAMADKPDMETVIARIEKRVRATQITLSTEEILESIHEGRR